MFGRIGDTFGERQGASAKIAGDQLIDDAKASRFGRGDEFAAQRHAKRGFHSGETRQPLRAAGAWKQTQLDLGKTDACVSGGDAVVASQRQFEAAAKRRAVQRRDDRLGTGLEALDYLAQRWTRRSLPKLADIGPGDERAPGASEHNGRRAGIRERAFELLDQAAANIDAERVDRRVVDRDHRDAADQLVTDWLIHSAVVL